MNDKKIGPRKYFFLDINPKTFLEQIKIKIIKIRLLLLTPIKSKLY